MQRAMESDRLTSNGPGAIFISSRKLGPSMKSIAKNSEPSSAVSRTPVLRMLL
jgi:hypothetical protein